MKISQFKPVLRTDVPEAREAQYLDKINTPVNDQIMDLTRVLQGQVSFWDNLNTEPREIKVRHQAWTEIVLKKLKGPPQGAILLFWDYPSGYGYLTGLKVTNTATIQVKVDFSPAPPAGTEIMVRMIVVGK